MEGVSAIAERETEPLVKQVALGQEPERQRSRKAWARKSKSRGRPGKGKKEFMSWGAAKKIEDLYFTCEIFRFSILFCYI